MIIIKTVVAAIIVAAVLTLVTSTTTAFADSSGNNGQCIQLQKTLPPDLQDYQGCHDTFTGPGHNEPPPLPWGIATSLFSKYNAHSNLRVKSSNIGWQIGIHGCNV